MPPPPPPPPPAPKRRAPIRVVGLDGAELAAALTARRERRNASKKVDREKPGNKEKIAAKHHVYYATNKPAIDARAYQRKIELDRIAADADPTFVPTKRLPKAARKHGVNVEQAPAITLPPEEVIAPPRNVSAVAPASKRTPTHVIDPTNPASFKNMIATIHNEAKKADTGRKYEADIVRIFRELGHAVPDDVLNVKPILDDYKRVLAVVPEMKKGKNGTGEKYAVSTLSNFYAVLMWVTSHFTGCQFKPGAVEAYHTKWGGHKSVADVARKEKKAGQTVDTFSHMMEAIANKYGEESIQSAYMQLQRWGPSRDNFGTLHVVDNLKGIPAGAPKANYLILHYNEDDDDEENGAHMALKLGDYKNYDSRGDIIKVMRGDAPRIINAYRTAHPGKYLFMKDGNAWGKMSAFVGAMLKGAGLKEPGHNVGSVNALRHSWASTFTDQLAPGAAAFLMNHSTGIHDEVYMDKLRKVAEEGGSGSTEDVPAEQPKKAKAVVRQNVAHSSAGTSSPASSSRPTSSRGPAGTSRDAIAGDSDDEEEVSRPATSSGYRPAVPTLSARPVSRSAGSTSKDQAAAAKATAMKMMANAKAKAQAQAKAREEAEKATTLQDKMKAAKLRAREAAVDRAVAALNAVRHSGRARRPSARTRG